MTTVARQTRIPGTEPKTIKEVTDAGEAYRKLRDKHKALTKSLKTQKEALVDVMRKHGLKVYTDDDAVPPFTVTVTEKSDVALEVIGAEEE